MNEIATPTPEQLHGTSWIVLGAMVGGLAVFAGVAASIRDDAAVTALPWTLIWATVGPLSVVLAKLIQRRGITVGASTPRTRGALRRRRPAAVSIGDADADASTAASAAATAHVLAWAVVEGPALLGIVAYLMGASGTLLMAALLTAAVGFALTAPTREAFWLR